MSEKEREKAMNSFQLCRLLSLCLIGLGLVSLALHTYIAWDIIKAYQLPTRALKLRFLFRLMFCGVLGACLANCDRPLYSNTEMAAPTISGNGRIVRTSAAGGLYQSTTLESPSGQTMVTDCMRIQRDWLDYLRATNASQPNQGAWNNWLQLYMMQRAITVADRCTDYATYGTPMSGGGGAGGFGFGGGRTFKR